MHSLSCKRQLHHTSPPTTKQSIVSYMINDDAQTTQIHKAEGEFFNDLKKICV